MKFKESQLIQFVEYNSLLLLRFRLIPRLLPHLRSRCRPRCRPGELGIILKTVEASEAWENYQEYNKEEQAQIPNCYIVHWQKQNEQSLVFENEIGAT